MTTKSCVLVTIGIAILFMNCDKKNDLDSCLGCGIDTSIREFEFLISGTLASNCSSDAASNRTLELLLIYKQDTLITVGHSDEIGNFQLSYKIMLPASYGYTAQWESYCLLKIKEDSVSFGLAGLKTIQNLKLCVGDSIDLNVFLDFDKNPLLQVDTLYYRFEPFILSKIPYSYKTGGPRLNHELINHIKDKRRFIEIDPTGKSFSKMYWIIRRSNSYSSSGSWQAFTSKITCEYKLDSTVINLN